MKIVFPLLLVMACLAGCASAPTQRVETIHVLGEVRKFRPCETKAVINIRHENETVLWFNCLDLTILKPEAYRGMKVTILLPFADGPYKEISKAGLKVAIDLNKRALTSNEPDWTVYRLEDLQIKEEVNRVSEGN